MEAANQARFVVKVCGITNLEDGMIAVEAGATALGFNFYERSSRFLTPDVAAEIAALLPGSVLRAGIFVNPEWDDILRVARRVPLDVVQVHGALRGVDSNQTVRLWKAMPVDHRFNPKVLTESRVEAYLLDTPTSAFGGSGQTFDWSRIKGASARFLLAGGLDASNVAAAIAATKPWGVDACSRLESRPGKKDAERVRAFVSAAREAFEAVWSNEPGAVTN
jgi:phosphoribosylanthranilate isomerase